VPPPDERPGLGLAYGTVALAESDPTWPERFTCLATPMREALGELALAIEHIGSTAVPGLLAKPILDIAVGCGRSATVDLFRAALEPLGYLFRGDQGNEGGLLFVLEDRPSHRIAHVHVVEYGGAQWARYLAFRDRLRADAELRDAYAALKRRLAEQYANNRAGYTAAKDGFVAPLLPDP
jgi:GrpB-like predicted nucleotidyltransferase (UPF0157 family)